MRKKYRPLNPNESYVCTFKDVKRYFNDEPDDVFIEFGTARKHSFDSSDTSHPSITGCIVAKASVNFRDQNGIGIMQSKPNFYISFYVLSNHRSVEIKEQFLEQGLHSMYDWYMRQRNRQLTALSGVEVLLIELNQQNLNIYQYRYH